jgi:hypothetical protein
MSIDLTGYTAVRTSLFVRIDVQEYRTSPTGAYTNQILRFSDHNEAVFIGGESYTPLGNLLNVTASVNELRPTGNEVTISISGIPNVNIAEILYSKIKGSPVTIYRGYFDVNTNNIIEALQFRYKGIVNNYSLEEEYDVLEKEASNTVQFECLSRVDILGNKIAGRRTNPESMQKYYPTDTSFNNIPSLKNRSFDFGAER